MSAHVELQHKKRTKKNLLKGGRQSNINIVVLGDEKVGKTSLISTFISRQFNEVVPNVMARVCVPDEHGMNKGTITTIIDTAYDGSNNDEIPLADESKSLTESSSSATFTSTSTAARTRKNLLFGGISIHKVDVIVLVYDTSRPETFDRIENYWLPLIEEQKLLTTNLMNIPVILVGNKSDLQNVDQQGTLITSNENSTLPPFIPSGRSSTSSLHQIVSLLQRFKFIRQSIKCSAKQMLFVNDVFLKAQQAVLYPILPLYDLSNGKLTHEFERILTRIFRTFDQDGDNLLSDSEINDFQINCFSSILNNEDLAAWKKILCQNNSSKNILKNQKFTLDGFFAIFDLYISNDQIDIPWIVLRSFGYNNSLEIEDSYLQNYAEEENSSWILTSSKTQFLVKTFYAFDSQKKGILSDQDLSNIFSLVSSRSSSTLALPPWHKERCALLFKSLPTSIVPIQKSSLNLNEWMNHWAMIAYISPSVANQELLHLGYSSHFHKNKKTQKKNRVLTVAAAATTTTSSFPMFEYSWKVLRIAVIGGNAETTSFKTSFVNIMASHDNDTSSNTSIPSSSQSRTLCTFHSVQHTTTKKETVIHFIITEIPDFISKDFDATKFDVVIFISNNNKNLHQCIDIEQNYLNDDIARIYVVTSHCIHEASMHCKEIEIHAPFLLKDFGKIRHKIVSLLSRFVCYGEEDVQIKPFLETKRREAERMRTFMLIGGLVSVAAVVMSVVMFWGRASRNHAKNNRLTSTTRIK